MLLFNPDVWYKTSQIVRRCSDKYPVAGRMPIGMTAYYRAIRQGRLPVKKLGRLIVARGADLNNLFIDLSAETRPSGRCEKRQARPKAAE